MSKKFWQSGTFWGALGTAVSGIGKVAVAVGTGDTEGIATGLAVIFGAFTAWRLRKGQGVEIA